MTDRNCKNCACYIEVTLSPIAPPQSQCRRNGPVPAQIRIERPLMRRNIQTGKDEVQLDRKTQQPMTEATVENVYLYAPTAPDKVCWDGWRPIGVPPGRPFAAEELEDPISEALLRAAETDDLNTREIPTCEELSRIYGTQK